MRFLADMGVSLKVVEDSRHRVRPLPIRRNLPEERT